MTVNVLNYEIFTYSKQFFIMSFRCEGPKAVTIVPWYTFIALYS